MASFLGSSPLVITRLVWTAVMPTRLYRQETHMLEIFASMPIDDVEKCSRTKVEPMRLIDSVETSAHKSGVMIAALRLDEPHGG